MTKIKTDGMQFRRRGTGTVQLRSTEEGESRTIEGTAIVFNRESVTLYEDEKMEIREIISPDAVTMDLLNRSTILLTLYHNNERILGRSVNGEGSLSYEVREDGVHFTCDMPNTEDGRAALELVGRRDITGCSFAFRTDYSDTSMVEMSKEKRDGKTRILYTVKRMAGIYDFTLTPTPAYESTEVGRQLRDLNSAAEEKPQQEEWETEVSRLRERMNRF